MHTVGAMADMPQLPKIKIPKARKRVPNREAVARVILAIPEDRRGLWLARTLLGLRPAEARNANMSHYQAGVIHLTADIVKTRDARFAARGDRRPTAGCVDPQVALGRAPWEPLFPNPNALNREQRWTYNAEWKCWARACRDAGVEHVRPNWGGCHHFATHEAKGGANLVALQQFMGHARFETTKAYIDKYDAEELALAFRPGSAQEVPKGKSRVEKLLENAGSCGGRYWI